MPQWRYRAAVAQRRPDQRQHGENGQRRRVQHSGRQWAEGDDTARAAAAKIAVDSRSERRSNDRGRSVAHRTRAGVIMSSSAKSLSHHGNQMEANCSQSTCFDATRGPETEIDARPTLAPMAAATTAINTNLAMPVGTAKHCARPPTN